MLTESSMITLSPGHVALFSRLLKPAVCFRPLALLPVQRCQARGELPGACAPSTSHPFPCPPALCAPHCACAPLPAHLPWERGHLFDVPLGVICHTCGRVCQPPLARSGFYFSRQLTVAVTPLLPPGMQCLCRISGQEQSNRS